MKADKKNIIVCGYQKSGTTWATRLVAQLLDAPSCGYWNFKGKTFVVEGEERKSDLKIYQSHQIYNELANDNRIHKIVYIVRDPRDVITSGMYHFNFYSLRLEHTLKKLKLRDTKLGIILKFVDKKLHTKTYKKERMIKMLDKGDPFIAHCQWGWNEHVSSYLNNKDLLIIKYEDLLLKGVETSQKILTYFNKQKPITEIEKDIVTQSFKTKKKEYALTGQQIKNKHLRKGVVGDWKNNVSKKDKLNIQTTHYKIMAQLNYL